MRRNPTTGQIAHGIAGDGVYVDGRQIAPGGGQSGMPDWMGDQVLHCAEAGVTLRQADGSTPMVVGVPAAFVRASSSGWAAWHDQTGVVASWGLKLSAAVLLDMAPDGTLLVGDNYQSGIGLSAYRTGSLTPLWRVPTARPALFFPYAQAAILDEHTACWTEKVNGRLVLAGVGLPDAPGASWNVLHPRLFRVNGAAWVVYLRSEDDMTIAHPWDYQGLGFSVPGFGYGPEASSDGGLVTLHWSIGAGERSTDIRSRMFNPSALEEIPPLPAPPVDEPIGPRGPSLPKGTVYDVSPFFQIDDPCWPRGDTSRGDTHGMDMQRVPDPTNPNYKGDTWWHAKFDKDGQGRSGELLSMDAAGTPKRRVHLRADASNALHPTKAFVDTWTDTTWLFTTMTIGQPITIKCERVWYHPVTRVELGREPYWKTMTLEHVWEKYWGGADVGQGRCIEYRYNVERYREFIGDDGRVWGWGDWDYTDPHTGAFAYSRFWLKGGQRFPVRLPNCPMPIAILPEEPPVPETIPTHVQATMNTMASVYPLPQGDPEAVKVFSRRVVEQVKFEHATPEEDWGLKSSTDTSPISNNITRRRGSRIDTWDWITGSAGPTPRLNIANAEHFDVSAKPDGTPAQTFHPVTATNHLEDQKPRPGRAPWPAEAMHGASGFDAAARVHGGDDSYYNETDPLYLNNFVYATIDSPATHRINRTFAEGLVQTESLCKRLAADNRQAMHVMLCGPANRDKVKLTRPQALDMIRQEVAMFLRYPKTVLALCMGNELYQSGFEADFMLDPTFWVEVEALIPLQFPFAIGQVGDTVVFGPGSFAVMHPDRGKSSLDALQILATAQTRTGLTVVAREPARIEAGGSGQSRGDIAFVVEELANAKRLNIPYFLHLAAGRGAYVPAMGDVEHQALALVKAAAKDVTPPTPPTPGHDILDVYLPGPDINHLSHAAYKLFETRRKDVEALAVRWYELSRGHKPADSDISVGVYIQGVAECRVWETLRKAWRNGWPLPAGVAEPS